MPVGLFGKYPQKRDFVSLGLPRPILEPFETWMQSAVAASRNQLGRDWQDLYLVAPLWRFWIGPGVFGTGCAGVTMPSVDGVGRFFPMTLIGHGEEGTFSLPPTMRSDDGWYRALEDRLLETLEDDATSDPSSLLSGLDHPGAADDRAEQGTDLHRGKLWRSDTPGAEDLLQGLRDEDYVAATAGRSIWWTDGSQTSGASVYSCGGLPDPYFYISMIGGTA
ncbi:MAG: type VI secretion system-associated protein TagF [Rhizobiaceae bacterium]|nr:type VI secretion system-associated protein TagF [Rhizobiaceae bacterium]